MKKAIMLNTKDAIKLVKYTLSLNKKAKNAFPFLILLDVLIEITFLSAARNILSLRLI
jgi:hypothetical protein